MKTDRGWQKIGKKPHHGILVPLSSLHSCKSFGTGEFLDLIPLIDFCKKIGFDVIQLLPINDTGNDASPYNALSSCALDPVYLSLHALPEMGELPPVSPPVKWQKYAILYEYFIKVFPSYREACARFCQENPWVKNYALFKSLKNRHQGAHFLTWPKEDQSPNDTTKTSHATLVQFYSFLQFLCFSQMAEVKRHATACGVHLKCDIPILISPDSVDVWEAPHLFDCTVVAGAPPDAYNSEGQKWGFPLFNWEAMRAHDFHWWKRRLAVAEKFFDIYRIDHVVGLFRIFAMDKENTPMDGFFVPADPSLWAGQGRDLLERMIEASAMLPIAEDLGTIPREVRPILKELGICKTCVMRWQRNWDSSRSYIPLQEYEPLSLTTVSTPDLETLTLWWERFPDEALPFAELLGLPYEIPLTQETRFRILRAAHATPSYFHINLLQEYLALFPELVSANPEDDRINLPGTILPTNWMYRVRPTVEEMLAHEGLCQAMQKLT